MFPVKISVKIKPLVAPCSLTLENFPSGTLGALPPLSLRLFQSVTIQFTSKDFFLFYI